MIMQSFDGNFIFILKTSRYPRTIEYLLDGHIIVLRLNKLIHNGLQQFVVHFQGTIAYVHFVCLKSQMLIQYQ